MRKFKVICEDSIELSSLGRVKKFTKDEEVLESIYTKLYPEYFKSIGEYKNININLSTPLFIPDFIEEFNEKEIKRKRDQKLVEVEDINQVVKTIKRKKK